MNIINWRCTQEEQICTLCQTERLNVIIVFMLLERENSFFYCVIPTCTNSFQVVHVQDFLHCLINCRKAERSDRGNNCRRSVGTRQWSIALVYPRPLIKPHYDGHHGIDIYLQDNASPTCVVADCMGTGDDQTTWESELGQNRHAKKPPGP